MRPAVFVLFALGLAGCTRAPSSADTTRPVAIAPAAEPTDSPTEPDAAPKPKASSGAPFGEDRYGFAEASSVNGRIVVLRRFFSPLPPSFGHHGESSEPNNLTLFDTVSGTERILQDVIDIDPSRRWLLVLAKGLFLVDATTGVFEPLAEPDLSPDKNACLPPRVATFSERGARVGWVQQSKDALRVRDLGSGQEWSVAGVGRLWRGWPDDTGRGATLLELAAGSQGWPEQRTSCACRWCSRFAASYGFYGWSGPTFTITHVDEAGARVVMKSPPASEATSHGPTDAGCKLEAAETDPSGVERGPWRWVCP